MREGGDVAADELVEQGARHDEQHAGEGAEHPVHRLLLGGEAEHAVDQIERDLGRVRVRVRVGVRVGVRLRVRG